MPTLGMDRNIRVPASTLSSSRVGAIVTVADDNKTEHRGRVTAVHDDGMADVRIFEEMAAPSESTLDAVLIQALPKKEKMAMIVQKATELGVSSILPCTSEKSEMADYGTWQNKSHRWQAIARKAVEQCRRRCVPDVLPCRDFRDVIASVPPDTLRIILYEKERELRLKDFALLRGVKSVAVACGAEGGFTMEEVDFARERGFVPMSLGGRILRCETATLAALTIIQYQWGDL
jgi:16S rRNA (uracil1498-N3)-methyltransferase